MHVLLSDFEPESQRILVYQHQQELQPSNPEKTHQRQVAQDAMIPSVFDSR
jgi:hypothetical protein